MQAQTLLRLFAASRLLEDHLEVRAVRAGTAAERRGRIGPQQLGHLAARASTLPRLPNKSPLASALDSRGGSTRDRRWNAASVNA